MEDQNPELRLCQTGQWRQIDHWDHVDLSDPNKFSVFDIFHMQNVSGARSDYQFCSGVTFNKRQIDPYDAEHPLWRKSMFYCHKWCEGKTPCVR